MEDGILTQNIYTFRHSHLIFCHFYALQFLCEILFVFFECFNEHDELVVLLLYSDEVKLHLLCVSECIVLLILVILLLDKLEHTLILVFGHFFLKQSLL
jgi:hypothetical protein